MTKRFLIALSWTVALGALPAAGLAQANSAPDHAWAQAISRYLEIQKSLASDSVAGVAEKAAAIRAALQGIKAPEEREKARSLEKAAGKLAGAVSLADSRKAFKEVSKGVLPWIEKTKPRDVEIMYCPMAGAKWAQPKGEIENPYFGKEMAGCGTRASS